MKKWVIVLCCIFILMLSFSSAKDKPFEIRILYLNDFHGFVDPFKPLGSDEMLGGITYLAYRVEELRKEKPSLLLSAGDMIQGHNWVNLFQGESSIELMNQMQFDAMVVGNHEFDFGPEVLKQRMGEAKFPVLGANVEGLEGVQSYVIKEVKGVRIAILGVVTEDTLVSTHPKNVSGLKFLSSIETVERWIGELKNKTDMVIVLSHIGYGVDRDLAEKVKGVDLIIGGHSHTKLSKPVRIGDTLIVQAWEYGKALGVLDLTIQDRKIIRFDGYLEEIKPAAGKEDKAVQVIVQHYQRKMDAVLNQRIGECLIDLDGERGDVRTRETNLCNFITDMMRQLSKADVTIINGGGIRTSIRKGEIRVKDVYNVLPFDNYIVAIKLTGKQIWEAMEHGVSGIEDEEGRFPQVSGLTFKYSPKEERGSRVKEISIAGQLIDLNKEYIVATNDFLAAGGDGFKAFGEAIKTSKDFSIIGGTMKGEKVVYSDSGKWLRDVAIDYIKEKRSIAPRVEGRIIEIR